MCVCVGGGGGGGSGKEGGGGEESFFPEMNSIGMCSTIIAKLLSEI